MDLHFACTRCANCCHQIRLPLTVTESIEWLKAGIEVQLICEASPWMPADARQADYLVQRSFSARSGTMSIRIAVTLAANIAGNCPNLLADLNCGIYERRPLACRVYPAETNPLVLLDPNAKACPPEAWASQHPRLLRKGRISNEAVQGDIQRLRELNQSDANVKRKVCAALNVYTAAIAEEGTAVHSPNRADLLEVLSILRDEREPGASEMQWQLLSDRDDTLHRLRSAGAGAAHAREVQVDYVEYFARQR